MNNLKTIHLMTLLDDIDNESNLDEFLSNNLTSNSNMELYKYFEEIFKEKKLKKSNVIKNAHIDRTYGYEILRGNKKPSRDKILQLCLGAGFTLEETNKALKLGNCGELYPKIRRDSIIIFGLNKNLDVFNINELLYKYELNLLGEEL